MGKGEVCPPTYLTMSGIQVSGLLSNQAFDWKSVVDQLVAADGFPMKKLNAEKDANTAKSAALATLQNSLQDLQDSLQSIRADGVFSARTVSSDTANTTWKSSSVTGTAIGSYKIAVQQLATAASRQGAAAISRGLSTSSDVTGVTLAAMHTATAITPGTFRVNGHAVTVELTDSLQDVFDKISAADPTVTASYDATTDRVTLETVASGGSGSGSSGAGSSSQELVLGAANDTSNFLAAMKLANNGTGTTASLARLGTVGVNSPLASAGLGTAATAVDSSGNGSFSINGVAISYNVQTDSLAKVISRINLSGAGVLASYDSASDRMVLTNKTTGDAGIGLSEDTGGLLGSLGLTAAAGGTLVRGQNALVRVNDGAVLSSASNTLDASSHGIAGLSVTVNSATTQTLQVESDAGSMQSAVKAFIDKFNAVQDFIETNTKITVTGSNVSAAVLSDNREVQEWGRKLRSLAFEVVGGVTGSVKRLDSLGIDFNGVSGHLTIKDTGKLATALGDHPDDVQSFFLNPSAGFVSKLYGYLTNIKSADAAQQSGLTKSNTSLDTQIATIQSRLDSEREQLTQAFIHMLDAQSAAQSQNTYLTNTFFNNKSSG